MVSGPARFVQESGVSVGSDVLSDGGVPGGFVPDPSVRKWRRPSVGVERSRLLVAASVPEGCVLAAPRVSVWLGVVRVVARWRGLREAQVAMVVRVIGPFVKAGWDAGDLVVAVDRRPDGSWWPHSGDRGVREPARWLIHRLSAWLDEAGAPLASWRQERQAAHERVMAEREARLAAREAERARLAVEREARGGGPGPGQLAARRAARGAAAGVGRGCAHPCRGYRRPGPAPEWRGPGGKGNGEGARSE